MVLLHRPMLRRNRRALDQRQQIALHAFARHVSAGAALTAGDFVDLVEKDDAVLLDRADRFLRELLLVQELVGFFVDQNAVRVAHSDAPRFRASPAELAENAAATYSTH